MAEVTSRDFWGFKSVEELKIAIGFILEVEHFNYLLLFSLFFFFLCLLDDWPRRNSYVLRLVWGEWLYLQYALWSWIGGEKARNGNTYPMEVGVFCLNYTL